MASQRTPGIGAPQRPDVPPAGGLGFSVPPQGYGPANQGFPQGAPHPAQGFTHQGSYPVGHIPGGASPPHPPLDLVIVKLEPSDTVPGTWVHPTGVHEGAEGLSSLHELVAQAQAAADAPLYSNQAAGRQASQGRPGLPTDNKWLEGQKLPQFSDEVQPLLHGGELTREEHHRLAKQFRQHIENVSGDIRLDLVGLTGVDCSRNLISDTSSGGRRWKYHYLGLTLASQFPKLQWDFRGHRASHGDHTKAKSRFLSKLAEARRHQHARAKSREVTVPLEPSS
ncbi:hypothetical protein HPB52_017974 [Rhipicephalus sanguineus]|uniref:Uncharacterized protein n=1 Tax=Rhipicephalus sanguineus TaxID=34632 RepID=A0A9D4PXA4_RHISA|nr:hypothetical protein HPB52_017974 [Rhipicephalus sanguineus]